MRHFLVACSAALALLATTQQKATAWNKFNFNIGMNIACEGAENNFLWGLFRNGPHPFAQSGGFNGYYGGNGNGEPAPTPYPYYNPHPASNSSPTLPAPMQSAPNQPMPASAAPMQQGGYYSPATAYNYPNSAYNYPTTAYNYTNTTSNYPPAAYNYTNTASNYVPSYWYGR